MSDPSLPLTDTENPPGMSRAVARRWEYGLVILCLLALAAIFQPFSKTLYGIGAGLIVFAGLAFNLMPFCEPGKPVKAIYRTAAIVAIVFVVVSLLAIGSAELYGVYLRQTR